MSQWMSTGALERAVYQMSTRGVVALDERRQQAGYDQLEEIESQFQIPIFGVASSGVGWNTFTIAFDTQYVFAPEQRDSPLAVPHFTYGAVVSGVPDPLGTAADPNNPASLCAVFCQVMDWGRDLTMNLVVGAQVGIGVSTIGGAVDVRFEGYVHLSFVGWGNVTEIPSGSLG